MEFIIKGVTNGALLSHLPADQIYQYSFDLRPKSFNFTQGYNIKNVISEHAKPTRYSLIFENEKDFVITELYKEIQSVLEESDELILEFSGTTPLTDLEKLNLPYVWHYHDQEKIKNIADCKNLKRIVFHHQDLEYLNTRGELHGFFHLFSDYTKDIYFEVQLDWNSDIILSLFDFFTIPMISFEIDSTVEVSYQNPDTELIKNHLQTIANLFKPKEVSHEDSHNE